MCDGARRRADRRRGRPRLRVPGIAFDTARPRARPRPPRRGARAARRAFERFLRPRDREGDRTPGDRGDDERDGCRGAVPRRRRGLAVTRATGGPDRGSASPGPWDRREPDDRAAGPLRRLREGVDRPAGAVHRRPRGMVASGGPRGASDDGRRPDRPGAPELSLRGAAHSVVRDPHHGRRRGAVHVAGPSGGGPGPRRGRPARPARVGHPRCGRVRRQAGASLE